MCGDKRHVSEESGFSAACEERKTPVREKPTVSHKCGRLRGNGTVHQASFTGCEKTPTLEKNNTSNLKSTTESSDAQEQNSELRQSTDAELSRTRLSAPYQTVCRATIANSVATIVETSVIVWRLC